jgi:Cupin superfamily protein
MPGGWRPPTAPAESVAAHFDSCEACFALIGAAVRRLTTGVIDCGVPKGQTSAARLPRSCLTSLVGAGNRARFLDEYWGHATYHGVACVSSRLRAAFALDVDSFKRSARALAPGMLRAYARSSDGAGQEFAITAAQIDELVWSGMTVQAQGFQRAHPPVAAVIRALREELGFVGMITANIFFSSPHSGYGVHFDDREVFNIQLEGTKDWRCAATPAIASPPFGAKVEDLASLREANPWFQPQAPRPRALRPCTLAPGDLLYMPPGTWHEASANEPSLSITFNFHHPSRARVLADQLVSVLLRDDDWRGPPRAKPPRTSGRGGPRRALEPTRESTFTLAERLEAQLSVDRATPVEVESDQPESRSRTSLTRGTMVRVIHPFRFGLASDNGDDLEVVTQARVFALGPEARPLLSRLASTEAFVAKDVLGWPSHERLGDSWPEIRDLLVQLIDLGLLAAA